MTGMMLTTAAVIFVFVNLVHLLALWKKDNGIMDGAWGLGFICVTLVTLWMADGLDTRRLLLGTLVLVWGLRLALHILLRNAGRAGEDFRYRNWRETWGRWFYVRSYFQIYMLQGAVMFLVCMPILLVNARQGGALGLLDGLGLAVWSVGFLFEAVGDYQLLHFMRNPANKGRVMRQGVWRFSRHPNYFGEATLWWGFFLMALQVPGGWWALISPVLIDFLLLYVSGIPMLEAKYKDRPDYQDYQRTTSAFFPWFPRKP